MKTLSFIFLITGMLFLAVGICTSLITFNIEILFSCTGFGLLLISMFILIQNKLLKYGKK